MLSQDKLQFWSEIFKGLANKNRVKIADLLSHNQQMSVTELSDELEISFKNTSRNLRILSNLEIVDYKGTKDRVYYFLNPKLKREVKEVFKIMLR